MELGLAVTVATVRKLPEKQKPAVSERNGTDVHEWP